MDTNLDRELDQLKMSQGMLGQTSQQVAEQVMYCIEYGKLIFSYPCQLQIRLLMKCKFLIEKDHSEKEMAVQVCNNGAVLIKHSWTRLAIY